MIPWLTTGGFLNGLINYNESKEEKNDAKLLFCNTFDQDMNTFKFMYHELIHGSKRRHNLMHVSLNFHESDRPKLNEELYKELAREFLMEFGYPQDQPYLIYEHTDKNHPHVHIAIPMPMTTGEWINMRNFPAVRMIKIARQLEKKYGLRQVVESPNLETKKSTRNAEYDTAKSAIQDVVHSIMSERPADLNEFNQLTKRYQVVYNGLPTVLSYETQSATKGEGKRGITFFLKDLDGNQVCKGIKGSRLPGGYSHQSIQERFAINGKMKESRQSKVKEAILETLRNASIPLPFAEFKQILLSKNISLNEYHTKTGDIFGIDFTDVVTGIRFKGSELDKSLSWNKLKNIIDTTSTAAQVQTEDLFGNTIEQNSKNMDKKPLELIKERFDLLDFVESAGYTKKKDKSTKKTLVYQLGKDTILLHKQPDGNYKWQKEGERGTGDIINFAIHIGVAQDYKEAIKYFLQDGPKQTIVAKQRTEGPSPEAEEVKAFEPVRMQAFSDNNYLIVDRGIAIDIVDKAFNGAVFTTTHEHLEEDLKSLYGKAAYGILKGIKPKTDYTIFPIYNIKDGSLVGQEIRHDHIKHFVVNSKKSIGSWNNYDPNKPAVAVFESPVDAISHQQLFPNSDISYFGTGGNPSGEVVNHIAQLASQHSMILAGDNDEKGQYSNLRYIAAILSNKLGAKVECSREGGESYTFSITSDNPALHVVNFNEIADKLGRNNILFDPLVTNKENSVSIKIQKKNTVSYDYTETLASLNRNILYFYESKSIQITKSVRKDFNADLRFQQSKNPNIKPKL
jgi:hypothetical protein